MSVREATSPRCDAIQDGDADMCPETMRSAGSGVYRAVDRKSCPDVSEVSEVSEVRMSALAKPRDADGSDIEAPTQRRDIRAA